MTLNSVKLEELKMKYEPEEKIEVPVFNMPKEKRMEYCLWM